MSPRAVVITVSDRSAAGSRADASGPVAVDALRQAGYECDAAHVVADGADAVEAALREALAARPQLVVTSGGTGIAPRDETPEGTARVLERSVPGIAEELRRIGAAAAPGGLLSRGLAGVSGTTLIVNLPGSPAGVADGIAAVLRVAGHVASQLVGGDHA